MESDSVSPNNAMNDAISIDNWLDVIDREYLSSFIKAGGSTVKFAVTAENRKQDLSEKLNALCQQRNFVFVKTNAVECGVHMPQHIFYKLASAMDWRLLARFVIKQLLGQKLYQVDGIEPRDTFDIVDSIARANQVDKNTVCYELRNALSENVLSNSKMLKAFRETMHHLCLMEMLAGPTEVSQRKNLLNWLTGETPRIGLVRHLGIQTSINRSTARYFIESTLYWVQYAGYSGTILYLDNTRVTRYPSPRDGKRIYNKPQTIEHYELLRQFIDDTDHLFGMFFLVVTNEDFIDEKSLRGWKIYQALQTRIMNDVRDEKIINPVAALVKLA